MRVADARPDPNTIPMPMRMRTGVAASFLFAAKLRTRERCNFHRNAAAVVAARRNTHFSGGGRERGWLWLGENMRASGAPPDRKY